MTFWVGAHQGKLLHAKFNGHKHCGSEDMILVYQIILLEDHAIKGSFDIRPWQDAQPIVCAPAINCANQEKGGLGG